MDQRRLRTHPLTEDRRRCPLVGKSRFAEGSSCRPLLAFPVIGSRCEECWGPRYCFGWPSNGRTSRRRSCDSSDRFGSGPSFGTWPFCAFWQSLKTSSAAWSRVFLKRFSGEQSSILPSFWSLSVRRTGLVLFWMTALKSPMALCKGGLQANAR